METNEPISNPEQTKSQPVTDAPVSQKPTTSKPITIWLLAILGALLLGTTGVFVYKYFELKQQIDKQPTPSIPPIKTTVSPSPVVSPRPTVDPTANWKTYINEKYDYEIKYPEGTVISEAKENEFSYETDENGEPKLDELKAIEQDKRFSYLFNKFSGKICVTLKYKFGYISISAPANNQTRYVICSPTGVGIYAENVKDSIEIEGKQIEVSGILQNDPEKDNLKFDNVFFTFDLENGTKITYGSSFDESGTLADWEKIKPEIKQILSTLKFTN